MTIASAMTEFVYGLSFEGIPPDALAAARQHLADSTACMMGASELEAPSRLREYAIAWAGTTEATLVGSGQKAPATLAALVNGTMVRYLDANDMFALASGRDSGHFSDATPAIVALAERGGHSGEELLTCLVASYELQGALAESFSFMRRGVHPLTQVPWTLPIVASRLIGATPAQAVNACGLSVSTGLIFNTWLKPSSTIPTIKAAAVGIAGQQALESAYLAAAGVTAPGDAIETAIDRLSPMSNAQSDLGRFEALGKTWTSTRNIVKAFPAQIFTQAAIETAIALHRQGLRAESVAKLTLYGHRHVCGGVQGAPEAFAPASREAADHSTPFVVATALLHGELTPRHYEGAPWKSPEVRGLMAKLNLIQEPERDRAFNDDGVLGVRLDAELDDGSTITAEVEQPRGHPDAPLTDAGLLNKMGWLLQDSARTVTAETVFETCASLSTTADVRALGRLLAG
jgi:2-methylcitrate dehydratase